MTPKEIKQLMDSARERNLIVFELHRGDDEKGWIMSQTLPRVGEIVCVDDDDYLIEEIRYVEIEYTKDMNVLVPTLNATVVGP